MEIIIRCSDDCRGSKNVYGEPITELVRCKDCKYRDTEIMYCGMVDLIRRDGEWYCADGERKAREDDGNARSRARGTERSSTARTESGSRRIRKARRRCNGKLHPRSAGRRQSITRRSAARAERNAFPA